MRNGNQKDILKYWRYAYKGIIPQDYLVAIPKGRCVKNFYSYRFKEYTEACI